MPIMVMKMAATNGGLSRYGAVLFTSPPGSNQSITPAASVTTRYLMGDGLMLADIQMVYLLEVAAGGGMLGSHGQYLDRLNTLRFESDRHRRTDEPPPR
ncbi:MAG: hypothetical protein U1E63_01650 [Burkholderiales bacterium]